MTGSAATATRLSPGGNVICPTVAPVAGFTTVAVGVFPLRPITMVCFALEVSATPLRRVPGEDVVRLPRASPAKGYTPDPSLPIT